MNEVCLDGFGLRQSPRVEHADYREYTSPFAFHNVSYSLAIQGKFRADSPLTRPQPHLSVARRSQHKLRKVQFFFYRPQLGTEFGQQIGNGKTCKCNRRTVERVAGVVIPTRQVS